MDNGLLSAQTLTLRQKIRELFPITYVIRWSPSHCLPEQATKGRLLLKNLEFLSLVRRIWLARSLESNKTFDQGWVKYGKKDK